MKTLSDAVVFINNNINFIDDLNSEAMVENEAERTKESAGLLIQNAYGSTAAFITGLVATIIFTFLLLIYRKGLTKVFAAFGDNENKSKLFRMLKIYRV